MDDEHKTFTEPPPKPARQSVIAHTVTKAKDSWEDSLATWSTGRKDKNKNRSTFYTTESYPEGE